MHPAIERVVDCADRTELVLAIVSALAVFESSHLETVSASADLIGKASTLGLVIHALHTRIIRRNRTEDTMSTTTKVTALTRENVSALALAIGKTELDADLTATTATFPYSPADALAELHTATEYLARPDVYGRRGYPVAALHAVRRKLERLA